MDATTYYFGKRKPDHTRYRQIEKVSDTPEIS